jgi:predicted NACHT family NTPase
VTAAEYGVNADLIDTFVQQVIQSYRRYDRQVDSYLIYAGKQPDTALKQRAADERIRLKRIEEYSGLLDFSDYVRAQTDRLKRSTRYPPALYVQQFLQYGPETLKTEALSTVMGWLREQRGRFILLLGEFGTGKTFLLREIARRLGEEEAQQALTPLLLEMRSLEKSEQLDKLVAQQLAATMAYDPVKFRHMLKKGRVVLLFDGYDELALRVTYDQATKYLDTVLEAAQGEFAKVVVTSRTQHFISDRQVKQKLLEKVEIFNHDCNQHDDDIVVRLERS